jgi:hypothetical protein
MENHIDLATQYGKLTALYNAVIYLNKEIEKEQEILNKLKAKEDKNVG